MRKSSEPRYGEVIACRVVRILRRQTPSVLIADQKGFLYTVTTTGGGASGNDLANEWLGCSIAKSVGLPVAEVRPIYITHEFLDQNARLLAPLDALGRTIKPGLQCGTRLLGHFEGPGRAFERLNSSGVENVKNKSDFAGFRLLNQWAGNPQPLQTVFLRSRGTMELHAFFVSRNSLFGGDRWDSLSADFHLAVNNSSPSVKPNEQTFLEWAIKLRHKLPAVLAGLIPLVHPAWYTGDLASLHSMLLQRLDAFAVIGAESYHVSTPTSSFSALRLPFMR